MTVTKYTHPDCSLSRTQEPNTAIERLTQYLTEHGTIRAVRVSAAQARGAAKAYNYWGAVRYELRIGACGLPVNVACERASSDRRSERLAERDAEELAEREGRVVCQTIGRLRELDAARILDQLDA